MHWKQPDLNEARGFDDEPTVQRPVSQEKLRQTRRSIAEPNEVDSCEQELDLDDD